MTESKQEYKKVSIKKIEHRITSTLTTNEALKDVEPMCWSEEVMTGKEKVIITKRE